MENDNLNIFKKKEEEIIKLNGEINKRDNIINLLTSVLEVVKTDVNIKTQQLDFLIGKMKDHDYNYFDSKIKIDSLGKNMQEVESKHLIENLFFKKEDDCDLNRIVQINPKNMYDEEKEKFNYKNNVKKKSNKDFYKSINIKKGFNKISFDDYSINYSKNKINNLDSKIKEIVNGNKELKNEKPDPKKSLINLNIPSNEYIAFYLLNFLNGDDLLNLSLVNKGFNLLANHDKIWNQLYFKKHNILLYFDEKDICNVIENAKELYFDKNKEVEYFPQTTRVIKNLNKNIKHECKENNESNKIEFINKKNMDQISLDETYPKNTKLILAKEGQINNPNKDINKNSLDHICHDSSADKLKSLQNFNFKNKYFELNKIQRNWEFRRPIVTTISTSECITGLNLNLKTNELICTSSDGSASLYRLYSYRKIYGDDSNSNFQKNYYKNYNNDYDVLLENDYNKDHIVSNYSNNNFNSINYNSKLSNNYMMENNLNKNNKFYLHMQHHKQTKICDKILNFQGHSGPIWCLDRNEDLLFTGSYDKTIKIWEISSGVCLNTVRAHSNWVSSVNHCKNFNILISSSWDSTIKLWKISDFSIDNSLILQNEIGNYIYCVRENLKNAEVYSGTEFKTVDIWDVNKKLIKSSLIGHLERVNNIKHHFDKNIILSGSEDKNIRLWDSRTSECEILFSGHKRGITQVEYDSINNRVISSSMDKTIKIWEIRKNKELRTLVGHSSSVYSVVFDQTKIISGSKDNSIRIWNFLN